MPGQYLDITFWISQSIMDVVKLGTFLTHQNDAQHLDAALVLQKKKSQNCEIIAMLDNDRNCVA